MIRLVPQGRELSAASVRRGRLATVSTGWGTIRVATGRRTRCSGRCSLALALVFGLTLRFFLLLASFPFLANLFELYNYENGQRLLQFS